MPNRNSSLYLLFDSHSLADMPWRDEDYEDILRHQLNARVVEQWANAPQETIQALGAMSPTTHPSTPPDCLTYNDLLNHPNPPLVFLG